MITTTRSRGPEAPTRENAFTLVELMCSVALSAIILAAVLTSFLFLARSGANISNYNEMETQARRSLEVFAQDTRQASSITWVSGNQVSLVVNSVAIVYTYTASNFTRFDSSQPTVAGRNPQVLVSGISAPVARTSDADTACTPFFRAYDITGAQIKALEYASPSAATLLAAGKSTKQLQISMAAQRTSQTVTTATNLVLSARFILRNKRITA